MDLSKTDQKIADSLGLTPEQFRTIPDNEELLRASERAPVTIQVPLGASHPLIARAFEQSVELGILTKREAFQLVEEASDAFADAAVDALAPLVGKHFPEVA